MNKYEIVDNKIDTIRKQQLSILNNVVAICNKHELTYFLDGGTLAGAIIYGGFGKYDDDIDISMPRQDFEKFLVVCQDELLPNNYLEYYTTTADFSLTFAKVKNRLVNYPEKYRPNHALSHVFIDIFPLDGIRKDVGIKTSIIIFFNDIMKKMIFMRNSTKKKTGIKTVYMYLLRLIKTEYLFKIYYFLFARESNSAYFMNHGGRRKERKNQVLKREYYFPAKKMLFMESYYSVPCFPERAITTCNKQYINRYIEKKTFSHIDIERL
ncbi:LicD family protein [Listeria booriae]|uniref:LicD family protein n=1 Tax=Listeria booriae TaxID=1552123 RepID=A0A7X0XLD1_9LIST|nr:LicD family protein [Listeria booriae]MBC1563132.1 LicD family protein [Listeria booriae]MBC1573288.1 LicD family protein [Listeria booriae]